MCTYLLLLQMAKNRMQLCCTPQFRADVDEKVAAVRATGRKTSNSKVVCGSFYQGKLTRHYVRGQLDAVKRETALIRYGANRTQAEGPDRIDRIIREIVEKIDSFEL